MGLSVITLRLSIPNLAAASSWTRTKHQITNVPIAMSSEKFTKYMAHSSDPVALLPLVVNRHVSDTYQTRAEGKEQTKTRQGRGGGGKDANISWAMHL